MASRQRGGTSRRLLRLDQRLEHQPKAIELIDSDLGITVRPETGRAFENPHIHEHEPDWWKTRFRQNGTSGFHVSGQEGIWERPSGPISSRDS